MKVRVEKELKNGIYQLKFYATDFADEERTRFEIFGVPKISLKKQDSDGNVEWRSVSLTHLQYHACTFADAEDANQFEQQALEEIRQKMTELRQRKDDFTSTDEVDL